MPSRYAPPRLSRFGSLSELTAHHRPGHPHGPPPWAGGPGGPFGGS